MVPYRCERSSAFYNLAIALNGTPNHDGREGSPERVLDIMASQQLFALFSFQLNL